MIRIIIGILGFVLIVGLFFFLTNKFKYKNIASKILVLIQLKNLNLIGEKS